MKALSIKQPWASLIAHGIKDIENRTWRTHFRGRIYIHSCEKKNDLQLLNKEQFLDLVKSKKTPTSDRLADFYGRQPVSAIIGEVDIIDCVINHPSIWAEKTPFKEGVDEIENFKPIYNWVLANPILYDKPILNVKGKLSFWHPETDSVA